jgi:DNA mismatch endonuclease (patch repair protein)
LHDHRLPGKPDIVLLRHRIAIFCDGDFWHGKNWTERRRKLENGANCQYWVAKIAANMRRSRKINRMLRNLNWTVVRVWESSLRSELDAVVDRITELIRRKEDLAGTQQH